MRAHAHFVGRGFAHSINGDIARFFERVLFVYFVEFPITT